MTEDTKAVCNHVRLLLVQTSSRKKKVSGPHEVYWCGEGGGGKETRITVKQSVA